MCGICGYWNLNSSPSSSDIVKKMSDAISHRGPDDEGFFIKDGVALGHRRLSIIDLSGGHQPIQDEEGLLTIIYNGEVYNFDEIRRELISLGHNFKTKSDTEVVLLAYKEWGPACLKRFNGMFALAIYDERDGSLFLARDRFGKKPLYWARFGDVFLFASEMKSLYQHPAMEKELDRLVLGKFLAYDYIPCTNTILKNVFKLAPASYLLIKNGQIKIESYWDFTFTPEGERRKDFVAAQKEFLDIFREAVRCRLVSDVPLGVFLSGGLDSSAVVAMMSTMVEPSKIKTFSIGFKDKTYDESSAARLVAEHFGTDHHEKILGEEDLLAVLPEILDNIDEPFADSSIISTYLVSKFAREKVTVALGGDGSDELFMGYASFPAHHLADIFERLPKSLKSLLSLAPKILPGGQKYMSPRFKAERFLRCAGCSIPVRHQTWSGSFPADEQKLLFKSGSDELFDQNFIFKDSIDIYEHWKDLPVMDKTEYMYIKIYLPDDILVKVDRASMLASLEVRAPFLDKDLAAFSAALPNSFKFDGRHGKIIVKKALAGILPEKILKKKKHGFSVPVGHWFKTALKDRLLETFKRQAVEEDGIFNYEYLQKIINDHLTGRTDNGRRLWALFVFQIWYNRIIKKENKE
jgi:asparagine synthase (glutamine-hydrolysing)